MKIKGKNNEISGKWNLIKELKEKFGEEDANDILEKSQEIGDDEKIKAKKILGEIRKSLKRSIFEFSPVSLVVIDRENFDRFEQEKSRCPNTVVQLLFHGTQHHPISCILTTMFKRSEDKCYQFGKGVYFTDTLDYCWFYGGQENTLFWGNKPPQWVYFF